MTRARITAVATAIAALTLTACSADPTGSATPSSSQEQLVADGTFVLYAGRDESLIQPLIDQFETATGITVEVRYAGTTELAVLLQEEGSATPADVFLSQDAGALGSIGKAGLAAPLPPYITEAVLPEFTSTDASWVGVTGRARVIVYDSEQLSADQVPTSVLELTDPAWEGKVAIPPTNASFQSFVTALRVLEGEEAAREWLEGMVANNSPVYSNNSGILDAVQAGEVALGLINHYYWFRQAAEVGADAMRAQLKFLPGDPGGIVNVTGAAILENAADDADARAFVEYLVSEEAQQYFVEETFEYPLLPGVDAPEGLPAIDTLVNPGLDLSDLDSVEESQRLLADNGLI
jgi:iron(III) transport system substrate-binding protein